ncbi:MAG: response regulator [Candidatus Zixiibacteriota bacterium]
MAFNVLVVDDSNTMRSIIIKVLKLTKLNIGQIFEANNGREALDCLNENWVDLVLSDLNMPVMSGIEMVRKMAENNLIKDIPVIVISTDGSKKRIEDLRQQGIREYIRKPFTPEKLGESIDRILGVNHE